MIENATIEGLVVPVVAGLLTAGLILVLAPWLRVHALARPNARSSHREPVPQGGGGAVVIATLAAAWGAVAFLGGASAGAPSEFLALTSALMLLAVVGAIDDSRGLPALPRLLLQGVAVGIVIAALPADLRVLPMLPWWLERAAVFVGCVWFVNLTNFMDGIDWMTVAESVPIAGAIALMGYLGHLPWLPALAALALMGAMLGFAPFNKPVAKLFLGDVGSLPIGLLLAWLLLRLAGSGHLTAAIILPLYYLAERRLVAGEVVWQAHRTHFYQRALDRGFSVPMIIARVFALNLALAALALATIAFPEMLVALAALTAAAALVGWLLFALARGTN